MFGWFKRSKPETMELEHDTIEAMFDEVDSDEEGELGLIREHTSDILETLQVDIKRRQFLFSDGTSLSITELTRRIHKADPTMPTDDIDLCITEWLEQAYVPEGISIKKMEKLQASIEAWVEDHQSEQETA